MNDKSHMLDCKNITPYSEVGPRRQHSKDLADLHVFSEQLPLYCMIHFRMHCKALQVSLPTVPPQPMLMRRGAAPPAATKVLLLAIYPNTE